MNMKKEMLEIMIGKHLDGEITPSEQCLLEAELDQDPRAKELLEQLKELHERCGEAIGSELLDRGGTPEEIFERAWRQSSKQPLRSILKLRRRMPFAAGLAAGLLIGLALHFVLPVLSPSADDSAGRELVLRTPENEIEVEQPEFPGFVSDPPGDVIRKVDWYNFTDKQGNKWLVEGLREDIVKPAAYYKGL
jgi:anti-sigma factor RsiW